MREERYTKRDDFSYSHLRGEPANLALKAQNVLRSNDMGGWTKAAPELYPHQWSWDSAFIAIGLAQLDTRRAARELESANSSRRKRKTASSSRSGWRAAGRDWRSAGTPSSGSASTKSEGR